MEETHKQNQSNSEKDMDLGVLFNLIRSLFSSLANGIVWLITSFFNVILQLVLYSKKHIF